jgi:NAD(P)-dependent dehydrogenase (short-subunit alcohol dehydrogenase family)
VDTDIAASWGEQRRAASAAQVPLGRMGSPEDYVGPTLWLSTAASAFVTGTLIRVDGGTYRQTS